MAENNPTKFLEKGKRVARCDEKDCMANSKDQAILGSRRRYRKTCRESSGTLATGRAHRHYSTVLPSRHADLSVL
jgi:hypothetical protein